MNLPIVDALRVKILGKAVSPILPPLMTRLEAEANETNHLPFQHDLEFLVWAEFGYRQTAPKSGLEMVRENAVKSLAHAIYHPAEIELREIQNDLRSMGLDRTTPAMQRIDRLIQTLRGEQPRGPQ